MPKKIDHEEMKGFAKLPLVTKLKKLTSSLTTIEVIILHGYPVVNVIMCVLHINRIIYIQYT